MIVYRRHRLPAIYTELPFVRKWPPSLLADCPEDISRLNELKRVASGKDCVSALESPHQFLVMCEFPVDILERDGITGDSLTWTKYGWKMYDVENLFTMNMEPGEATSLQEAGIDRVVLDALASRSSCIPLLRKTTEFLTYRRQEGYSLTEKMEAHIQDLENRLFAGLDLGALKNPTSARQRTKPSPSVSVRVRDKVMRRDGYRCIFCGHNRDNATLEVNHIIPKSLIAKLHLSSELLTAEQNLCVTCFECNRGKSDNLAREDVSYYINAFSTPSHPNHGIIDYLSIVQKLQAIRDEDGGGQ